VGKEGEARPEGEGERALTKRLPQKSVCFLAVLYYGFRLLGRPEGAFGGKRLFDCLIEFYGFIELGPRGVAGWSDWGATVSETNVVAALELLHKAIKRESNLKYYRLEMSYSPPQKRAQSAIEKVHRKA